MPGALRRLEMATSLGIQETKLAIYSIAELL